MRIVIDARMQGGFGIGRYNRNLLSALQAIDSTNQYFLLLRKKEYQEESYQKNFTKVLADFHWYGLKEQLMLPKIINSLSPDIVHFPHFNIPVFYRGKFIVTIHDLIHQHFHLERATTHGKLMYKIKKRGYDFTFSQALKNSKTIITVSDYVKNCLVSEWGVSENKVVITKEGVEMRMIEMIKRKDSGFEVLKKFNIHKPYLFYVGNANPHKNVEGLIKAFLKLRKKYQYLELVLAGSDDYFWKRIKTEYNHKDIKYTGYVTDEELIVLYKNAEAYVIPSFEEGFGIPLLEAMACGIPVISSNKASLPEIGGDAALYFNPEDIDDMVEKISVILNNQNKRAELISLGEKRLKQFSWEECAKETLKVYLN